MNKDVRWLKRMAEDEANAGVSVGGLACEASKLSKKSEESVVFNKLVLSRLVALYRRLLGMRVEELAATANVDVSEVIALELGNVHSPQPRTIFMLAKALRLPSDKLMQLSGLTEARDGELSRAAIRFAASSNPIRELSKEERYAVEEFVRILTGK